LEYYLESLCDLLFFKDTFQAGHAALQRQFDEEPDEPAISMTEQASMHGLATPASFTALNVLLHTLLLVPMQAHRSAEPERYLEQRYANVPCISTLASYHDRSAAPLPEGNSVAAPASDRVPKKKPGEFTWLAHDSCTHVTVLRDLARAS
jgi:hypothetical protein